MKVNFRTAAVSLLICIMCGCKSNTVPSDDAQSAPNRLNTAPTTIFFTLVDSVKPEKDPKGGWFSASIKNVYFENRDEPQVFCGSGPKIPTGKRITIFVNDRPSTPDSVRCTQVVQVVDGKGYWYKGRGLTEEELISAMDGEEHLVEKESKFGRNGNMFRAWMKAQPVGEPCEFIPQTSIYDVSNPYKGKKCSAIFLSQSGLFTFINWNITGNIEPLNRDTVTTGQIVDKIVSSSGSKYLISQPRTP